MTIVVMPPLVAGSVVNPVVDAVNVSVVSPPAPGGVRNVTIVVVPPEVAGKVVRPVVEAVEVSVVRPPPRVT